jgi:guanine nucleotide-binding protein G(I)/G(S)/G(T) subunit beta-1
MLQLLLHPGGGSDGLERDQKYSECEKDLKILQDKIKNKLAEGALTLSKLFNESKEKESPLSPQLRERKTLKGHFGKIYGLAWSNDATHLVSASQDGKIILWNSRTTNKRLAISLHTGWVMALDYAPSGNFIASGGLDNVCSVFKITEESVGWDTTRAYAELRQHEGYISDNKFIDDTKILTASGDSTIIVWDLNAKHPANIFKDHTGDVMSVDLHPTDKNVFVSGSTDATVKLWDLRESKCTQTFRAHSSDVNVTRFFPSGRCLASGSDDSTIRLWDVPSRRQLNQYDDLQNSMVAVVTDLDFTLSGSTLFASYDDEPFCLAWNTLSAEKMFPIPHNVRAPCLRVNPAGFALATGGWDFVVRVFA